MSFSLNKSIGYQVRLTNRLLQRHLQQSIEPHGVTLGMWYFLRVMWDKDGLTQRELSRAVGTMEPTTLAAIKSMEAIGLVKRIRNAKDKRKINLHLTKKGQNLQHKLLPIAKGIVDDAMSGLSEEQSEVLFLALNTIQNNVLKRIDPGAAPL